MQLNRQQVTALKSSIQELENVVKLLRSLLDNTLAAPSWPQAVPQSIIVPIDDDNAKKLLAKQIVNRVDKYIIGNVLDYNCAEGWTTAELANHECRAYGYNSPDQQYKQPRIERDNLTFFNKISQINEFGPYDLIICYDVLDHDKASPLEILSLLSNCLSGQGILFVRFHPWTSRHGAHQYYKNNLAYWHLTLTEEELLKSGLEISNFCVIRPLSTYEGWIQTAGLKIINREIDGQEPENFFTGSILDKIIKNTWSGKIERETALKIMSIQFIDYFLQRAT